jgi:hypothetical protein
MNRLQFVDDTLLLGGPSVLITMRFKTTLDSFLDASVGDAINSKC